MVALSGQQPNQYLHAAGVPGGRRPLCQDVSAYFGNGDNLSFRNVY